MKKIFFLISSIIIIIFVVYKSLLLIQKEYDYIQQINQIVMHKLVPINCNNFNAIKTLVDYLNEQNSKLLVSVKNTEATFVDLDADGIDELVGYTYESSYQGALGTMLFILKKDGNKYSLNISPYVNIIPKSGIYILNTKTNGYKDIGAIAGGFNPKARKNKYSYSPIIFEFNQNKYLMRMTLLKKIKKIYIDLMFIL